MVFYNRENVPKYLESLSILPLATLILGYYTPRPSLIIRWSCQLTKYMSKTHNIYVYCFGDMNEITFYVVKDSFCAN